MYKYCGFGVYILSEIEFPELKIAEFDQCDIELSINTVPNILGESKVFSADFNCVLNDTQLYFYAKNIGKYLASDGNSIIIELHSDLVDMRLLRMVLLGTVMSGIIIQRKQLLIHASALLHQNELVLICGDSGAGKSTSLAGLIKKGYAVFSDDVVVLNQQIQATASLRIKGIKILYAL